MTSIELMTENPKEMVELITRIKIMEGMNNGRKPMFAMPEGIHLRGCRQFEMSRVEGLAKAPAEEKTKTEAEKIVGKLIEDLRAHAKFAEEMMFPGDMQSNLLLAARIIEILWRNREIHQICADTEKEQICEAVAK